MTASETQYEAHVSRLEEVYGKTLSAVASDAIGAALASRNITTLTAAQDAVDAANEAAYEAVRAYLLNSAAWEGVTAETISEIATEIADVEVGIY
jgi:hypothetical protein